MRSRWHFTLVALATICALHGSVQGAQPAPKVKAPADPVTDFAARITAYVALHRRLANETGEIDETKSPQQIADRERALGIAVQQARASAKTGDIFTPPIAAVFKKIIAADYRRRSPRVRADRKEAQDELADFVPAVNQVYPPTQPLATFPAGLLKALPKLPKELEYRLVQRYLILRDVEANLILDILPAVTPR